MKYSLRPRPAISFTLIFACLGLACSAPLRSQEGAGGQPPVEPPRIPAEPQSGAPEPAGAESREPEPADAEPTAGDTAAPSAAAEGGAAGASAADLLERFADTVVDLETGFEQTIYDASGEVLEDPAAGRFLLLRPDRFLWHQESPFEQLFVADGETLWSYDVDLEQVSRDPLESLATTPAMLLAGSGDLSDRYHVERLPSGNGLNWIALEPIDSADSDFISARIAFDERDVPARLEIVDGLENLTRIEFLDVEVNPGLDPSLFDFEPPAGVHVVGGDD